MEDKLLLTAMKRGDEEAFRILVDRYSSSLMRLAMVYVGSRALAEEVVQETWLGAVDELDGLQEGAVLKTWVFKTLTSVASTRGAREQGSAPFSSPASADDDGCASLDLDRFFDSKHERYADQWALGPTGWDIPDQRPLTDEANQVLVEAVEQLPRAQRAVITLHDIERWPSDEVCDALDVTDRDERALLHLARTHVRAALERHFDAVELTVARAA